MFLLVPVHLVGVAETARCDAVRQPSNQLDRTGHEPLWPIAELAEEPTFDQIRMQRLKKQKLTLRDEIASIEAKLVPDIIA